jgi:ubiquinone/menaquinone biosynthesis C-methylase UbiE
MSKKHREVVQKQFTRTAEAFSITAVRDAPEVLEEKVAFARPQPADLALDVACGPGIFSLALAPRVRFARGIDLTEAMIRQARTFQAEKQVLNAAFDCGEAEALPYPNETFDLVTCQMSFHHMPEPRAALAEMVRVAKPAARIVVIDTLAPESDAKFELYNAIEEKRDPSHTRTLRLTTFLKMFDDLELEILRQSLKRRQRSFHHWMLRAGLEPKHQRYQEARKMLEDSILGDKAGHAPVVQGDDIVITHNEGLFLLGKNKTPA